MKFLQINGIIIILGILTALLFIFGFSNIFQFFYELLGSPPQASGLLWLLVLVQSFVMGAIPGIIAVFMDDRPVREVVTVFVLVIMLSMAFISAGMGGASATKELIFSFGTWLFVFGVVVGSFSMHRAKHVT